MAHGTNLTNANLKEPPSWRQAGGRRCGYWCFLLNLVGLYRLEQELPQEVQILFNKTEVPRLTLTRLWIWNCGTETIRGSQIVEEDSLRCYFDPETRILSANVASVTRSVNRFAVFVHPARLNEATLAFDYLDPNDGARVEILHTSKARYPTVAGTIRGIPKGIKNLTPSPIPHAFDRALDTVLRRRNFIYSIAAVCGAVAIVMGLLPEQWLTVISEALKEHKDPQVSMRAFRFALLTVGALYLFMPLSRLLATRKKYPVSLDIESDATPVAE